MAHPRGVTWLESLCSLFQPCTRMDHTLHRNSSLFYYFPVSYRQAPKTNLLQHALGRCDKHYVLAQHQNPRARCQSRQAMGLCAYSLPVCVLLKPDLQTIAVSVAVSAAVSVAVSGCFRCTVTVAVPVSVTVTVSQIAYRCGFNNMHRHQCLVIILPQQA